MKHRLAVSRCFTHHCFYFEQAKRLGLMTVGMDAPGLLKLIKGHIKKSQTSEVGFRGCRQTDSTRGY